MKKLIITLTLLYSLNIFAQWELVTIPTTENLIAISFKDNTTGFCIAENGIILKTTNGGINWVIIVNNPNHIYTHLASINNKIIVFGSDILENAKKVFTSTDEGINWSSAVNTIYPYYQFEDLQVLNNEIYYRAIGSATSNLYKFNDNNPLLVAENVRLFGATESTNEIIYFGLIGNIPAIFKSYNNGVTWQQLVGHPQGFGPEQTFLAKMSSFNNTILIHYTYNNNVAYSIDNGANWVTTFDDNQVSITTILNSTTMYGLVNFTGYSKLYTNTNYLNWVEQTQLDSGVALKSIYFKSPTLGFIIGQNGVMYRTENGGLSVTDYESLEKSIKVYPVPAKDVVQIELPLGLKVTALNLYDTNGRLVQLLKNSESTLQINNLSSGIYLLEVSTDKGVVRKKIIVE